MKTKHLLLTFFLYTTLLSAQNASGFQFRKYQVNEGLSENTVASIIQDKKGFLWLGTKDGLNKFDGINFTIYRNQEGNEKSLGNNFIKSIVEGKNNELYIGTDDGLYIMNVVDETFEKLETKLNVVNKIITSITDLHLDKNGLLWITSRSEGVYVFDIEKTSLNRIKLLEYDLTRTDVWTVFEDKSGGIWIGSRIGLLQYNRAKSLLEPVDGLVEYGNNSDKEVLDIFEDEKGNLWLGTWADGIVFYNKQQNGYSVFCGPQSNSYITHIRSFLQYDTSNLLVGADDGLFLFDTETKKSTRIDVPYDKYSLGDQNVYCIFRDHEGGIWIGTYFGGLNYLNSAVQSIDSYLPNDKDGSLSGKAVSQFCEDEKGNLWIATEDGGLNYFDTKTKHFSQPVNTSYHNIHPLMMVGDELWIGTFSRGLDIYNTKTQKLRNYRNISKDTTSINDDCIFSLYRTKSGDIYIGTTIGLNKYNPENDNFTRINTDSLSFVYDFKEDSYRNLWIASYDQGIVRLNQKNGKWTYYSKTLKENNPTVNDRFIGIYIDSQKRLWFSSEGHGIFLYDYDKDCFINISENDGLPNNVVYGILDDQLGNIWASSNKGLVSFPPSDINLQKRYSQDDGLQSNQFNYKSSFKASDGKLYFGGINGFNSFYPQELSENRNLVVPSVEITGMQLLGKHDEQIAKYILKCINQKQPVRLKHNNSSFTISYVSLSYVAQVKNQFAYKLEGVDTDWNNVGNNRSVTYVNLAPGKYVFRVKASNNHNVWNEQGAELQFEIMPPFWLSLSAKIIYALLFILVLYGIFFYFTKRNKLKQQTQLEAYKNEQETLAFKSKIDFFTNIAHEIRTPVSLIKAPLEEIIHSNDGNKNTKQNLSIIEKNSERLNVLINQLLDFRKMDTTEYTINASKINLIKHLSELYERFRKTAQSRDIDFQLVLPAKTNVEIVSDADALTKIIGNFLTNALKFTKDKIILKLDLNSNETFTVSVIDNGNGIPDDLKTRIFDSFYQIQSYENKKGTGIGLFLAKHLSEILGGNIKVEDNPDEGSVFIFTFNSLSENKLPENASLQKESALTDKTIMYGSDSKKNILIVEDNIDMLHFIENSLKSEHKVDTAENAMQAIEMINEKSYNLIITDIMMPDIDGLEFTRQLRENVNYSHIPVILLSAKTDNNTKIEGLSAGADVFIEKPFSVSYLKAQISTLLANRKAILEAFNRSPLISYSILTTNKSDQDFINRLNEEIDKNISDSDFSIESLTDKLFISRSNLQRKLKSICGVTPGDYLRTYRLKKATQLLLEDGLRINEVVYEVGFSSPSYFTKCFVKQYGVLPKEFIKQNSD